MKRAAIAAAILAASTTLAGCGGGDEAGTATEPKATTAPAAVADAPADAPADAAACEKAYQAYLEKALKAGVEGLSSLDPGDVPDACDGFTAPELEKIIRKVTDAAVKAALEDASNS